MLVDGRVVGRADRRCDPHAVVPCSNAGGIMSLDTLAVFRRDGAHTITVQAIDGGYNVASATRRVYVDNTAPGQPGGLVVAGGGAWRSVNRFAASWAAPANYGSPIAGVVYELCRTDQPQACVSGRRWGSDLTSIRDLVVPAGARRLRRPCAEGASTLKVRVLFPHGHNPGFGIPVYAGGAHPPDREGAAVKVTARLTKKGRRLARAHGARKLAAKLGSAGIADYWRNPIRGEAPERTWVPIGTCFHDYQRPRSFPCAQTCPPFPGMPTGYLMYTALDMVYGSTTCRRGAALPPVPMG
jgi:hypothetical protein